jgi:hypothetical protein
MTAGLKLKEAFPVIQVAVTKRPLLVPLRTLFFAPVDG